MQIKLLGLCAAMMALAVLGPSAADASPLLTDGATAVAVGTKVTATGLNSSEYSSGFTTLRCNDYWVTGTVLRNNGSEIQGTIERASFNSKNASNETEDCSSTVGATKVTIPGLTNEGGTQHWCVEATSETPGEGTVQPHGCGGTGGSFTFVVDVTNYFGSHVICRYSRTTNLPVSYTIGTDVVSLKGEQEFSLEATSSSSCSSTSKLKNMSFTLELDANPFDGLTIS